jgi:hypothetical protein
MTPIEIDDYKTTWLKNAHVVQVNEDLDVDGKSWCRKNVERHRWSFSRYTDIYEHTFYFEIKQTANDFESYINSRTNNSNTTDADKDVKCGICGQWIKPWQVCEDTDSSSNYDHPL